jgi:hypothetical protein
MNKIPKGFTRIQNTDANGKFIKGYRLIKDPTVNKKEKKDAPSKPKLPWRMSRKALDEFEATQKK